jgi:hypothetical protein
MVPIDFLPEADQEMLEAARYYQSPSSGPGVDYLAEVEHAVQSIALSPHTWPVPIDDLNAADLEKIIPLT